MLEPAACVPEAGAPGVPSARAARAAAFLPSLTDVAFIVPILALFIALSGAQVLLGDGDTGWHLLTGKWILANGRVPDQDLFSYTKAGQPWIAWEWLWDAAFGWVYLHWGLAAVLVVNIVVLGTVSAWLFRLARRSADNSLLAILFTILAMSTTSIHWLARPHLMSWLLILAFYSLLERAQAGRPRGLLWLPLLTVLWTNLHGGFIIGLIVVGAYALGELIRFAVEPEGGPRRAALGQARRYLVVLAACAVATLLNPYGYKLHVHIFGYLSEPYHFGNITEYLSLSFHHPIGKFLTLMILLGAVAAAWDVWHRRFVYPLLLVVWAYAALLSARNIPVFVILAAPRVAACAADLLARLERADVAGWLRRGVAGFNRFGRDIGVVDRLTRIPVLSLAAVLMLALLFRAEVSAKFRAEYDPQRYPARAVEFLREQGLLERVYTDDEWGDYLIFRLYPQLKVFIDGRSDFYGGEFERAYVQVLRARWNWEKPLNAYGVQTVLLPVDSPLAPTLKECSRWRTVYDDRVALVFRRAVSPRREGAGAEGVQASAVSDGGVVAVAGLPNLTPVIHGSQSYARR